MLEAPEKKRGHQRGDGVQSLYYFKLRTRPQASKKKRTKTTVLKCKTCRMIIGVKFASVHAMEARRKIKYLGGFQGSGVQETQKREPLGALFSNPKKPHKKELLT